MSFSLGLSDVSSCLGWGYFDRNTTQILIYIIRLYMMSIFFRIIFQKYTSNLVSHLFKTFQWFSLVSGQIPSSSWHIMVYAYPCSISLFISFQFQRKPLSCSGAVTQIFPSAIKALFPLLQPPFPYTTQQEPLCLQFLYRKDLEIAPGWMW